MKNLKSLRTYLVLVMALGLSVATISCGDDESAPDIASSKDVEGSYTGKMLVAPIAPEAQEADEAPVGAEVDAVVNAAEVAFAKFPVKDIIAAIIPAEQVEAIVKAVGDVTYKLPYAGRLSEDYTQIDLTFAPEPLVLDIAFPPVAAPTEGEAEAPKTKVTVTFAAAQPGVFTYEGKTLKFNINIVEVKLGENPFAMPATLKLSFDLAQ